MAIVRKPDETDETKLGLEINNGDFQALKQIKEKFSLMDEEAVLRYALAVLSQSVGDTLYIEDGTGNKVGLKPSASLLRRNSPNGQDNHQ
jgi:hypothetical protein